MGGTEGGGRAAIKKLKTSKAEGIDNMPGEMFKSVVEGVVTELIKECQDIYTTGVNGRSTSCNPS